MHPVCGKVVLKSQTQRKERGKTHDRVSLYAKCQLCCSVGHNYMYMHFVIEKGSMRGCVLTKQYRAGGIGVGEEGNTFSAVAKSPPHEQSTVQTLILLILGRLRECWEQNIVTASQTSGNVKIWVFCSLDSLIMWQKRNSIFLLEFHINWLKDQTRCAQN